MAPAVPQPLLELHSTSVIIDGSVVVDRVSLTVGRGEFVLLRGPTGSGKSTVLKLLAGLVRPTSGEVIVAGRSFQRNGTPVATSLYGAHDAGRTAA